MKLSKQKQKKRDAALRALLEKDPQMTKKVANEKLRADVGVGVGSEVLAEMRRRVTRARKRPPGEALERPAAQEPQLLTPTRLDDRHLLVIIGEEEIVERVLRRLMERDRG